MAKQNYLNGVGGEPINGKKNCVSIRDMQRMRKHHDVVIIENHCGIEIIRGIRAGVIIDAHERGDYDKSIYHWPVKIGRKWEDIVILCCLKTGDYSLFKGEDAKKIKGNIPEGFEVEFSYFKKVKKA